MFHKTIQKLEAFTDHVEFERMVLDILSYLDYPGIDPQSPDLADGGKDGLYYRYGDQSCVWFAFSLQKRWKRKFNSDLVAAVNSGQNVHRFVFCTNRCIPALERDKLKESSLNEHGIEADFFDGERLRVALDTVCKDVRQNYLGIVDNTTIRRQLRYILLDPENEVSSIGSWRAEIVFLESSAPRGVFGLLKDTDLSSVCETGVEVRVLSELMETYFMFRMLASKLESYTAEYVGEHLPDKNFIPYWKVIAGYCIRIAAEWDEEKAMRWSKIQNISHNGKDCQAIASVIVREDWFQNLVSEVVKLARSCDKHLTAIRALQSLMKQPRYDL
jgi:hypothetical protein